MTCPGQSKPTAMTALKFVVPSIRKCHLLSMSRVANVPNSVVEVLFDETIRATNTLINKIVDDSDESKREVSQKFIHLLFICASALPETSDAQYPVPIHPSRHNGNCGWHFGP